MVLAVHFLVLTVWLVEAEALASWKVGVAVTVGLEFALDGVSSWTGPVSLGAWKSGG